MKRTIHNLRTNPLGSEKDIYFRVCQSNNGKTALVAGCLHVREREKEKWMYPCFMALTRIHGWISQKAFFCNITDLPNIAFPLLKNICYYISSGYCARVFGLSFLSAYWELLFDIVTLILLPRTTSENSWALRTDKEIARCEKRDCPICAPRTGQPLTLPPSYMNENEKIQRSSHLGGT